MQPRETLPNSVGFTGPDGVGKTNFALLTVDLLRQHGNKVVFCPFPFLEATASGKLLRTAKKEGVSPVAILPLYAMNRYEVLPALKDWLLKGANYWVVTDRVWQDGPVYAEAVGMPKDHHRHMRQYRRERGIPSGDMQGEFKDWLHALEAWFPEVDQGFYITRPLHESIKIMQDRAEAEDVKSGFDKNIRVQKRVRSLYPKEFNGLTNWSTIRVRGVVSGREAIQEWQIPYMKIIWSQISKKVGHPEWVENTEETIRIAQMRGCSESEQKEIKRTVRTLSRSDKSFYGLMRGVHSWMPKQGE